MQKQHTLGPSHQRDKDFKKIQNVLIIAIVLVFTFMVIEFIGGYLSRSLALVSDAFHMLTDLFSLIFALFGIIVSQRKATFNKSYGYSRLEVIMSFANALFLVFICIFIIIEAFKRMYHPEVVNPFIMLPVAVAGLIINFIVMILFKKANYGDHHHLKDSNQQQDNNHKKPKSLLLESAYLHVLADMLGSLFAIIVGIVIYFTENYIVDPILSIVLVILILRNAYLVLKNSFNILMESSPADIKIKDIEEIIENNLEDVIDIHHIHLWMLNEHENIITLHAIIKENANIETNLTEIKKLLLEKFNISHSTIQIETPNYKCLDFYLLRK